MSSAASVSGGFRTEPLLLSSQAVWAGPADSAHAPPAAAVDSTKIDLPPAPSKASVQFMSPANGSSSSFSGCSLQLRHGDHCGGDRFHIRQQGLLNGSMQRCRFQPPIQAD